MQVPPRALAPRERESRKRRLTWVLGIVTAALLLLIALLVLGFQVRFLLNNELELDITPKDVSLVVANDEQADIALTVRNDNFIQCKSRCTFTLIDLASRRVLHTNETILLHGETRTLAYAIPPAGHGSGQRLYTFTATCHNIRKALCATRELPTSRSALIALTHELRPADLSARETLRPAFEAWLASWQDAKRALTQAELYARRLPAAMHEHEEAATMLGLARQSTDALDTVRDELARLWHGEEYDALARTLDAVHDRPAELAASIASVTERIRGLLTLRNANLDLLAHVKDRTGPLTAALQHYAAEASPANNQRLTALGAAASGILAVHDTLRADRPAAERDLHATLNASTHALDGILDGHALRAATATTLRAHVRDWLAAKDANLSLPNASSADCAALRALTVLARAANNASRAFRAGPYAWSLANATVEMDIALAAEALANASLQPAFQTDIPLENLTKMAILNASALDAFLPDHCGTNATALDAPAAWHLTVLNLAGLTPLATDLPSIPPAPPLALEDPLPQCCTFGTCTPCCDGCPPTPAQYPVLFIHGHMFNDANTPEYTMAAFTAVQRQLEGEGYVNAGELDLRLLGRAVPPGDWARSGRPVTVRASYYYILGSDIAGYHVDVQKSERIENYALRLREIIELVKRRTGMPRVNIVAHSMGGLVAREYLALFGGEDVHTLVTINTPHQGITSTAARYCTFFGASKECEDMTVGSIFLDRLTARPLPTHVGIHAIRSTGCPMAGGEHGDGIVTDANGILAGAENILLQGTCTDRFQTSLHTDVLDPDRYPETYRILRGLLAE